MKKYLFLLLLCVMSITSKAQFAVSTSGETVVFSINNVAIPIFRSDKRVLKKLDATSFQIVVDAKVNTVVKKADITTINNTNVATYAIEDIIILINNMFEAIPVRIANVITNEALATDVVIKNFPFSQSLQSSTIPREILQVFSRIEVYTDNYNENYSLTSLTKDVNSSTVQIANTAGSVFLGTTTNMTSLHSIRLISSTSYNFIDVTIDLSKIAASTATYSNTVAISKATYRKNDYTQTNNNVAVLGDSRTAQTINTNYATFAETGTYINQQSYSFMLYGDALSKKKVEWSRYNFGVSGERTDQVLARISALDAYQFRAVVVWCGVNDISQGVTGAVTFSNIYKIYERLSAKGIIVIAVLDNFATNWVSSQYAEHKILNTLIRNYVTGRKGFYLIDANDVVTSYTSESPVIKTGIFYDNIVHIGTRGAYYLGQQLAVVYDEIMPQIKTKSFGANESYNATTNPNQLISNLAFSGTGGTSSGSWTGTVPMSWRISSSSTSTTGTISTGTSAKGYPEVTLVVTSNAAENKFAFSQDIPVGLLQYNTKYRLEAEVEIVNPINLRAVSPWFETNIGSTSYTRSSGGDAGVTTAGSFNQSCTFFYSTPALITPSSGTVNWLLTGVRGIFDGAGSCTLKIRNIRLYKEL